MGEATSIHINIYIYIFYMHIQIKKLKEKENKRTKHNQHFKKIRVIILLFFFLKDFVTTIRFTYTKKLINITSYR